MTRIATESLFVLADAFFTAIRTSSAATPSVQLDGACPITDGKTLFYFDLPTSANFYNDPCSGMDWYILAYLTIIIHIISWGGRWMLWEPAAMALAKKIKHPTFDHYVAQKISTNMTECSFFMISGFFAWRLFVHEWWLYEPDVWLQGRETWHVDAAVKFYYILYAARFVSDFMSLFFEVGRNTTALLVACIHHMVTLGLIAVAIGKNYIRAAAIIMFFFDWADPFVLLAKTCRNLTCKPNDWFQFFANRFFEGFAISFFISRSVIYNFVAYKIISHLHDGAYVEEAFLIALVILQTYWLGLIINAAVRSIQNGGNVEEDNRETSMKKKQ